MANSRKLAVFDLDYTLTQRGTWGRFTWQLVKFRPHVWLPLLVSAGLAQYRYKKGKLPRVRVKMAMMTWSMKGKSKAQLLRAAEKFAHHEVPHKLRPGGLRVLREHQREGDAVIIVSAAVDILVEAIARKLDIEHFLATDMDWDDNDIVKMSFASPNCYGEEKCVRFDAFMERYNNLSDLPSIMYSDSHSDIFLMRKCNEAVAVHPSAKLVKLASEYGYPIVDWSR